MFLEKTRRVFRSLELVPSSFASSLAMRINPFVSREQDLVCFVFHVFHILIGDNTDSM